MRPRWRDRSERLMRGTVYRSLFLLALWGCEPPPPVGLADPAAGPGIEILYPRPGDTFVLDERCLLTEQIVVHVTQLTLAPPSDELVEGEGHWHGGPDLSQGYCFSDKPFCAGAAPDPKNPTFATYDGSGMRAGLLTLFVALQDNLHGPLGVEDQVEVTLTDPSGHCVDGN